MPFSYTISQQEHMVRVVADGPIDLRSSVDAMHAVAADPDFNPDFHILVDLRRMEYSPSTDDLIGIRDTLFGLRYTFQGGVTLVVPPASLYLARLVCILTSAAGFKMTAVTDIGESESAWPPDI